MKRTFQLFWHKSWDNLFHLVVCNLVWFTFSLPLFFGLALLPVALGPESGTAAPAENAEAGQASGENAPAVEPPPAEPELSEYGAVGDGGAAPSGRQSAAGASELEVLERASMESAAAHGRRLVLLLLYMACCWVVFCIATGFVFFAMADIVAEYDFSGYRYVAKKFLRRGPVLRSIAAVTLFAVTLAASLANIIVYLHLAGTRTLAFLILAGIMAWFVLLVIMTFALAMPLVAQREMRLFGAIKTAAVLALSAPMRTLFVLAVAGAISLIAILSMAGFGFFVIAAPAVLFNAEARSRIDQIERETGGPPRGEEPEA